MKLIFALCFVLLGVVTVELLYASNKLTQYKHIEPPQVMCTSESHNGECYNGQGTFIGLHKDLRKHYAGPVSYSTIRKAETLACATC